MTAPVSYPIPDASALREGDVIEHSVIGHPATLRHRWNEYNGWTTDCGAANDRSIERYGRLVGGPSFDLHLANHPARQPDDVERILEMVVAMRDQCAETNPRDIDIWRGACQAIEADIRAIAEGVYP